MRTWPFAVIAVVGVATSCLAQQMDDGNNLLRRCNAAVKVADGEKVGEKEGLDALICASYLNGFIDSHALEVIAKPQKEIYCLPEKGLENGQVARIVTKHLKDNPKTLHWSARTLVGISLSRAFPCSK
jgi:hypothetical protein